MTFQARIDFIIDPADGHSHPDMVEDKMIAVHIGNNRIAPRCQKSASIDELTTLQDGEPGRKRSAENRNDLSIRFVGKWVFRESQPRA